ncbi:hypothetical protein CP061683_0875B, partial [Chlamydia psittaci 06-1683]
MMHASCPHLQHSQSGSQQLVS